MTSTKIAGLTGLNIAALEEAHSNGYLPAETVITKTTATFPWAPDETAQRLGYAKDRFIALGHSSRQHPVGSLNAVIRKARNA